MSQSAIPPLQSGEPPPYSKPNRQRYTSELRLVPPRSETALFPPSSQAVKLGVAVVLAVKGAVATVMYEGQRLSAERAVSCLVAPVAGDLALLSVLPDITAFVLGVLRREAGAGVRLIADGDLAIEPERGRFRVNAPGGVELRSCKTVRVHSACFALRAPEVELLLERLTLVAREVQSRLDQVKVIARSVESVADRVLQRVKRSFRIVEEHEQVQVHSADIRAAESLRLRGKHTAVTAREEVRLDGKQIHLGRFPQHICGPAMVAGAAGVERLTARGGAG